MRSVFISFYILPLKPLLKMGQLEVLSNSCYNFLLEGAWQCERTSQHVCPGKAPRKNLALSVARQMRHKWGGDGNVWTKIKDFKSQHGSLMIPSWPWIFGLMRWYFDSKPKVAIFKSTLSPTTPIAEIKLQIQYFFTFFQMQRIWMLKSSAM